MRDTLKRLHVPSTACPYGGIWPAQAKPLGPLAPPASHHYLPPPQSLPRSQVAVPVPRLWPLQELFEGQPPSPQWRTVIPTPVPVASFPHGRACIPLPSPLPQTPPHVARLSPGTAQPVLALRPPPRDLSTSPGGPVTVATLRQQAGKLQVCRARGAWPRGSHWARVLHGQHSLLLHFWSIGQQSGHWL